MNFTLNNMRTFMCVVHCNAFGSLRMNLKELHSVRKIIPERHTMHKTLALVATATTAPDPKRLNQAYLDNNNCNGHGEFHCGCTVCVRRSHNHDDMTKQRYSPIS